MINQAQFINDFPEFNDPAVYTPSTFNFWLNYALQLLNVCRWGASAYVVWPTPPVTTPGVLTLYDIATELYVAHNLTLEAQAQQEAANGLPPGLATGILSSEGVDKASAGFDTATASEEGGGYFNLTVYGTRLLRLMRQAGAGGMYIGIGELPIGAGFFNGPAWPGPYPFPSPTGFSS